MTPNVRRLNTRLPLAVAALALLVGSTGCGGDVEDQRSTYLHAEYVDLPDGRVVTCVYSVRTGIDCDWATAAREGEVPNGT